MKSGLKIVKCILSLLLYNLETMMTVEKYKHLLNRYKRQRRQRPFDNPIRENLPP